MLARADHGDRSAGASLRRLPVLLVVLGHDAAAREGRRISIDPILEALDAAPRGAFRVVEGVGGFLVPLADDLDTGDLARAVALPVVLVVGLRLGCLNHSLLTARAIAAAGLALAGWIANGIDPRMAVPEENVDTLRSRLPAPLLGRFPWQAQADARALARRLDVRALLA